MTKDGTAGDVSVSGSQGVQTGSGNTQNNYYGPPGPNFLTTLSPHNAVTRLRTMPHEGAISVLASAPPDDAAEVLKVLLDTDQALAVALLADVNPRCAKSLIEALVSDAPWLEPLAEASKAISQRAGDLKWDRDGDAGHLERVAPSLDNSEGYVRKYAGGLIYWSSLGTYAVRGAIAEAYMAPGGPRWSGFPKTEELVARPRRAER
jgi:hypothetical protein